jgi:Fe-S-cluster containining protein
MSKKQKSNKSNNNEKGNVCITCEALCCRDVTMMITKPRTKSEIDELLWYLHYDSAKIFIRSNKWYLSFDGKCRYLDKNNLCTIYEKRSRRCRTHNPPECEKFDLWYDTLISSPEEFREHLNI